MQLIFKLTLPKGTFSILKSPLIPVLEPNNGLESIITILAPITGVFESWSVIIPLIV